MFSITPLSFDALSPMNPSNISTNLILKRESLGYIIVADSIDQSSFKFSYWAPNKTHVFWNGVYNDPSRSSKVIDFGTNQKRVYDFLFDFNSNLGPILPCFRDIRAFIRRKPLFSTPPLFGRKFRGVPLGVDPSCWGCKERTSRAN